MGTEKDSPKIASNIGSEREVSVSSILFEFIFLHLLFYFLIGGLAEEGEWSWEDSGE